jgi:hypothetical protein
VAALLGASVDTRVLPASIHGIAAYVAIAANVAMLRVEVAALLGSARVVAEVDRLLNV